MSRARHALVLEEGRLVDEHVGRVGVDLGRLARPRVARDDDPPPRPLRADDLLGLDAADLLAALEAAEVRPLRHAERPRGGRVEAAGAVVLHERVAVGGAAVLDRERGDEVAAEADLLVGLELLDAQRVARAAEHEAHRLDQRAQARAARRATSSRSRARRSNDFTIPTRPSQWSRWKWVMNTASSSGSPTERSSCCWVPSPQSNSSRSPPARSSVRGQAAARGGHGAGGAGEEQGQVHLGGPA